jgi:hypothetical protein
MPRLVGPPQDAMPTSCEPRRSGESAVLGQGVRANDPGAWQQAQQWPMHHCEHEDIRAAACRRASLIILVIAPFYILGFFLIDPHETARASCDCVGSAHGSALRLGLGLPYESQIAAY